MISMDTFNYLYNICDMIKRSESDVADIDFEILATTVFKFFVLWVILALTNYS